MKYDFTSIMDRHGKDAIAIDGLGTAPGFTPDAPKEGFDAHSHVGGGYELSHPCPPSRKPLSSGRNIRPSATFPPQTPISTPSSGGRSGRNGVTGLTKECIGYENGVLGGVVSALNVICSKGDNVPAPLSHLHRIYRSPEQQRVPHRPLSPQERRTEHLADGL